MSTIRAVGMAWYRQADYPRILEIMVDSNELPATWEKWRYRAEKGFGELTKRGMLVEKVYLDPDEFTRWCEARHLDLSAKGRLDFANEFVARKYGTNH